jgi:hypothetical protein
VFTAEVPHEALRAYAASRGLAYEEEGLLPPISAVLREGLGAGSHLAGLVTRETGHGYTSEGGFTRREERHTFNLCRGVLPGGVDGLLAHHQHLEERSTSEGSTWVAAVDTVVVARLPERSRAVCELNVTPGATGSVQALFSLDVSGDTPLTIPGSGVQQVARGSHTFRLNPPEDEETLEAIASPDTLTALAHAPQDTRVEYVDGVLCVSAAGIIEDAGVLDTLCAVAMGIVNGIRAAVARHGELDAGAPLPAPAASARQQWLDAGVARVRWERPPAGILDARAAYEPLVAGRAGRSGRRARTWVLLIGLLASLVWVAVSIGFALIIDDPIALLAAPFGFLYGIYKTVRIASESGGEVTADEVTAQAGPWALEAFARGYARARGLTIEDPDALRHRLTSPVAGRPLRAMHGDLGGGVTGHLALWRDWVRDAHWIVAVVAAPSGPAPEAAAPYQASRSGSLLVVGRQVTDAQRTAAELDALAAEARRLASRGDADRAGAESVAAREAGPAAPQPDAS